MGLGEELGGTGSRRGGYADGRARGEPRVRWGMGRAKFVRAGIQKSLLQSSHGSSLERCCGLMKECLGCLSAYSISIGLVTGLDSMDLASLWEAHVTIRIRCRSRWIARQFCLLLLRLKLPI
jgi:hypothetical protein